MEWLLLIPTTKMLVVWSHFTRCGSAKMRIYPQGISQGFVVAILFLVFLQQKLTVNDGSKKHVYSKDISRSRDCQVTWSSNLKTMWVKIILQTIPRTDMWREGCTILTCISCVWCACVRTVTFMHWYLHDLPQSALGNPHAVTASGAWEPSMGVSGHVGQGRLCESVNNRKGLFLLLRPMSKGIPQTWGGGSNAAYQSMASVSSPRSLSLVDSWAWKCSSSVCSRAPSTRPHCTVKTVLDCGPLNRITAVIIEQIPHTPVFFKIIFTFCIILNFLIFFCHLKNHFCLLSFTKKFFMNIDNYPEK